MGLIIFFGVLVGVGLAVFIRRDGAARISKEAFREASHMNMVAVDIELESLYAEWKKFGVLSEQQKAFLDALHCRRLDLLKQTDK